MRIECKRNETKLVQTRIDLISGPKFIVFLPKISRTDIFLIRIRFNRTETEPKRNQTRTNFDPNRTSFYRKLSDSEKFNSLKIFSDQLNRTSEEMVKIVDDILEEEGLTRENLVIGGFSQGGALALNIALNHYENVAGILAMSTFLPIDEVKKIFEHVLDISREVRHFSIFRHLKTF
jgi:hypothetical protein